MSDLNLISAFMKDTQSRPDLSGCTKVLNPVKLIPTQTCKQNISDLIVGLILFDLNLDASSRDLIVRINYFLYCTSLA